VPRLFGKVVTASGSPVPAAQVQLRYLRENVVTPANTTTDADGQFSFNISTAGQGTAWLAAHADTRRCLVLIGEMISMPGLVDRLSETLLPEERT